jgi:hypothetical protein
LKYIHLKKHVYIILLLISLVIIAGCGGGESSSNGTTTKSASLSVGPLQDGIFTINGSDMDGVASMNLTLGYPGVFPPMITAGALVSGGSITYSSPTSGVIEISIARPTPFSGSGPIVKLSFDSGTIDMVVTIKSVTMLDINGHTL